MVSHSSLGTSSGLCRSSLTQVNTARHLRQQVSFLSHLGEATSGTDEGGGGGGIAGWGGMGGGVRVTV